jgi:hypothetical protein
MKGYVGVMKSMMAELTDETNIARGFSMLPVSYSLGYAIGSVTPSAIRHYLTSSLNPRLLVLSLGACYHDRKIAGQASFRTLSGLNTHTSFHASWLLPVAAPRSPLM